MTKRGPQDRNHTERIYAEVRPELKAELQAIAYAMDLSLADVVRRALRAYTRDLIAYEGGEAAPVSEGENDGR